MKEKIAVAMSGGVDSSVAAWMLQKQGYEVFGVYMRLRESESSMQAEAAARRVCQFLGIKFYPINISDKFEKEVIEYFQQSYQAGFTPNPCVRCNNAIKFGELIKRSFELGACRVATGHYAKLINNNGVIKMFRPVDSQKDQTYFLYHLSQDQLSKVVFPLSDLNKTEIKKIATVNNLPFLTKESQDICFLSGDHNDYLRDNIKLVPGDIMTLDNVIVGHHQGLPLYTIGQRKGVEIGGIGPFYVAKSDYINNVLYVTNDSEDSVLSSDALLAINVSWISGIQPHLPLHCSANIRYRHKAIDCVVELLSNDKYLVKFSVPQRAIAPGQSVVFYNNNEILGGGEIFEAIK